MQIDQRVREAVEGQTQEGAAAAPCPVGKEMTAVQVEH